VNNVRTELPTTKLLDPTGYRTRGETRVCGHLGNGYCHPPQTTD
jgi:hypothetical protein